MFKSMVNTNLATKSVIYSNQNDDGYFRILQVGTYFYPAWRHYGRKTLIMCDRCNRQDLQVCIGYRDYDICLECVSEIVKNYKMFFKINYSLNPFVKNTRNEENEPHIKGIKRFNPNMISAKTTVRPRMIHKQKETLDYERDIYTVSDNYRFENMIHNEVVKFGHLNYPAWIDYGEEFVSITCDLCFKQGLFASIGLNKNNLCLECVSKLSKSAVGYYPNTDLRIMPYNGADAL